MSVTVGTTLPLDIRITQMPEYDDNDQYIGACQINGVPHHITLSGSHLPLGMRGMGCVVIKNSVDLVY